jgi:hypothetical protein
MLIRVKASLSLSPSPSSSSRFGCDNGDERHIAVDQFILSLRSDVGSYFSCLPSELLKEAPFIFSISNYLERIDIIGSL